MALLIFVMDGDFLKMFFKPLLNIGKVKWLLPVWIILILICGQLGIIFETILSITSESSSSFFDVLKSGSLYTFSIALIASSMFPIFQYFINKRENNIKAIRMVSIILGFGFILIMTVFYVALDDEIAIWEYILQGVFYILSLLFSVYYICLENVDIKEKKFEDLADESLNKLYEKSQDNITSDGEGNAI